MTHPVTGRRFRTSKVAAALDIGPEVCPKGELELFVDPDFSWPTLANRPSPIVWFADYVEFWSDQRIFNSPEFDSTGMRPGLYCQDDRRNHLPRESTVVV